jgi:Na+-transporting NADH:ubiquinone oxidoreductase subunit A
MRVEVRRGMDLPIAGEPSEIVEASAPVGSVALLGDDFPGVRGELQVQEGDRVALGQTLFVDRRRPALRFVSPAAGRVSAVRRGEGRRLTAVVVGLEGEAQVGFPELSPDAVRDLGREATTARLLDSGAWAALRARPFGGIPHPGEVPAAIFVRAIATDPLGADPAPFLRARADDLSVGLAALTHLTDGSVFLCMGPGDAPELPEHERVRAVHFAGPHPAGLVGTHIHHLCPVSAMRRVWYLGYQDVFAIGALLRTGRIDSERVIALGGGLVERPRLLRTYLGASTEDLVRGELVSGECRIVSGSVLSGRRALRPAAFLGRYHEQLCALPLLPDEGSPRRGAWLVPRRGGARRVPPWRRLPAWTAERHGARRAILPLDLFDRVVPLRIPIGLLLRALAAGDVESAERYGALELEEEDLALCSFLCPSKLEYGPLLRRALAEIEAGLA